MPAFLDVVEGQFGTRDLYEVLGVGKEAGEKELKKAYHRLSLKVHPDRVEAEAVAIATEKFQSLGKIYSILTDKDKRAIYNEDGTVDEEDSSVFNQDRDWSEYWRLLFKKVTSEDIQSFEADYRGSEEEAEAVRTAYIKYEGDMDQIMDEVMCATLEDEPRFREMISNWISEGAVEQFPSFVHETELKRKRRKRKWKEEEREAEEALREMGGAQNGDSDSLKELILSRHKSREGQMANFFDSLEEKYAKKRKPGSSSGGRAKPQGKRAAGGKGKRKAKKSDT